MDDGFEKLNLNFLKFVRCSCSQCFVFEAILGFIAVKVRRIFVISTWIMATAIHSPYYFTGFFFCFFLFFFLETVDSRPVLIINWDAGII